MHVYKDMIAEVLRFGTRKENRTGIDTISTFNHNYELAWGPEMYGQTHEGTGELSDNRYILDACPGPNVSFPIPLLTTKEISWKNIVVEMLWFLSGSTNIEILKRHGCKFWNAWADDEGEVPSAYGHFWRQFPTHMLGEDTNDQIAWNLKTLRNNPMSRRNATTAWHPFNAQTSKLPPCHLLFVWNVQNVDVYEGNQKRQERRLCLHLTQRSCDLALGVPYNMASYGLLLAIMSHLTGIKPGIFAHTLIDLHIYTAKPDGTKAEMDHVPGLKEQAERPVRQVPRVIIDPAIKELKDIEALMAPEVSTDDILRAFCLVGYDPAPAIKFKVAV